MTNLVHIDLFLRSRLEFKQVSFHDRTRCWDSIFKWKTYSQARKFGGSKQVLMLPKLLVSVPHSSVESLRRYRVK